MGRQLDKKRDLLMYHQQIMNDTMELDEDLATLELRDDDNAKSRSESAIDDVIKHLQELKTRLSYGSEKKIEG